MNVFTNTGTITDLGEFALISGACGIDPEWTVCLGGQSVAWIRAIDGGRKGFDVRQRLVFGPSLGTRGTVGRALDLVRQVIGDTSRVMRQCDNPRVHNPHSLLAGKEAGPGRLCPGKVPTTAAQASRAMRRVIDSNMGSITSRLVKDSFTSRVDVVSSRCAGVIIEAALASGLVREARYAMHGGYVIVNWKTA